VPHTTHQQPELFRVEPDDPNVEWLVRELAGMDWLTAAEILRHAQRPVTDGNKRWLRALAAASKGRVAGGQRGYKLVEEMTVEEYHHWRDWMKSQADFMTARILEADKVFYRRQKVRTGTGILTTDGHG
jgi:hypothetical protein